MKRRGFTIVELCTVIAILAVLMMIVIKSAAGAIAASREKRADAIFTLVGQGMSVYYAREGKWPGGFADGDITDDELTLSASQVRNAVKALVECAREGKPVMDISGLFVSRQNGESDGQLGVDFMTAIHGTRNGGKKMKLAEMYFGYPEKSHGWFKRLKITYHARSDTVSVGE